jgi:hypothetical protein
MRRCFHDIEVRIAGSGGCNRTARGRVCSKSSSVGAAYFLEPVVDLTGPDTFFGPDVAIRQINKTKPTVATKIEMLYFSIESVPPSEHSPPAQFI